MSQISTKRVTRSRNSVIYVPDTLRDESDPINFAKYAWPNDAEDDIEDYSYFTRTYRPLKDHKRDPTPELVEESYKVGDVVLIRANDPLRPSLAVITRLYPMRQHGSKFWADVQWFKYAEDKHNKRKHAKNEVYFVLDHETSVNAHDILVTCQVSNAHGDRLPNYNYGVDGRREILVSRNYICLYAHNPLRDVYYLLNWESHYSQALQDGEWLPEVSTLMVGPDTIKDVSESTHSKRPQREVKVQVKRRRIEPEQEVEIQPTPRSKRSLISRFKKTPRTLHLNNIPVHERDVYSLARTLLHVGATPDLLPCREEEFAEIELTVETLLEEGQGGCVYISGVPGTGKTATVHGVIASLKAKAARQEINPFTYVEINGLKLSTPAHAYSLLWNGINGDDTLDGYEKGPKQALLALDNTFHRPGPGRKSCVVLMDELDQLVSAKQSEIYNFFNWPTLPGSRLIVLAVANTMDMPEKVFKGKVASRLGMTRINFHPYDRTQLVDIVLSRLRLAVHLSRVAQGDETSTPEQADTESIFTKDAVAIAAGGVAAASGDARRVLDITRRALEMAAETKRQVGVSDINKIVRALRRSPHSVALRSVSLYAKLMLIAIMRAAEKAGSPNGQTRWGDAVTILYQLHQACQISTPIPNSSHLALVLSSLVSTQLIHAQERIGREGEAGRTLKLEVPETDLRRELSETECLRPFLV